MAGKGKEPWTTCEGCGRSWALFRTSTRCSGCAKKRLAELAAEFDEAPKTRVVVQLPIVLTPLGEWDFEQRAALGTFLVERCADALAPLGVGEMGQAA